MSGERTIETPEEGARRLARAAVNGAFAAETLHVYRDANGQPLYWRWRVRKADGEKVMRPMRWNGRAFVAGEPPSPAEGKPLYRLPELFAADPAALVVIVEGEKCADVVADLGLIATTSGSCSSASSANWQPLAGRCCLIWPDHDNPGSRYADDVIAKLGALNCTVEVVDVKTLALPDKGDVVDWLALRDETTAEDIRQLARVSAGKVRRDGDTMPHVILTRGSEVEPVSVDWLWDGWLAAGKLHVMGGAPGTGKTTIAAALAGIISSGSDWPDGTHAKQGSVVFWSGEDDNADTLNPRLRAAGADMNHVFTVDGMRQGDERYPFDPARDMAALQAVLSTTPNLRLIVIDPIVSAVSGDSHKNAEVRRGLQPLVDLAGHHRCALLGITHFSKGTGGRDPVERITGSLAFGALARVVMVTAKHDAEGDRQERRVMVRAKSNIGPDGDGFAYDLQQGQLPDYSHIIASAALWGDPISGSARELLAATEHVGESGDDASGMAARFLHDVLAHGPRRVSEVKAEAETAGIAWRTIERAKRRVGVEAKKNGMSGGWEWAITTKTAKDRQAERVAAFGGLRDVSGSCDNGCSR